MTQNKSDSTIALYIHIPFCKKKCGYCSFVSFANKEAQIPVYLQALKKELRDRITGYEINSIYFGGGTPSLLLPSQINDLLHSIGQFAAIRNDAEITIEANPGMIHEKYLINLKQIGINRLSLGIQSLHDSELRLLGRIHDRKDALESIANARKSGFSNINLDLIYGVPGQTPDNFRESLLKVLEFSPEHVSLYPLTLEKGTPLYISIKRGEISALNSDIAADQYELAEELLSKRGYIHYEISNWSKVGCECRHNLVYWKCSPYIGTGVAAHSYLDGHRLANTGDLDKYINTFEYSDRSLVEMDEGISDELQVAEAIIMGLRLAEGISFSEIQRRFGLSIENLYRLQIDELCDLGLLEEGDGCMKLTGRGRLLGNEVFLRFLPS